MTENNTAANVTTDELLAMLANGKEETPKVNMVKEVPWQPLVGTLANWTNSFGERFAVVVMETHGNGLDDTQAHVAVGGDAWSLRKVDKASLSERPTEDAEEERRKVANLLIGLTQRLDTANRACREYRDGDDKHSEKLAEIRAYAIARHQEGQICRDGLDEFLRHFDMEEYSPVWTGSVTITVDVRRVEADSQGDAESMVRDAVYQVLSEVAIEDVEFGYIDNYRYDLESAD